MSTERYFPGQYTEEAENSNDPFLKLALELARQDYNNASYRKKAQLRKKPLEKTEPKTALQMHERTPFKQLKTTTVRVSPRKVTYNNENDSGNRLFQEKIETPKVVRAVLTPNRHSTPSRYMTPKNHHLAQRVISRKDAYLGYR
jgi:hypothetical protein